VSTRGATRGRPVPLLSDSDLRRFWSKVLLPVGSGCMTWTAYTDRYGYGMFRIGNTLYRPHRVSYELLNGPIEPGRVLDHLCRNRACVAPSHLEAVSQEENVRRGNSPTAVNARKTHCPQGHSYSRGGRKCRVCNRAAGQAYRANQKRNKESQ
jgi:hypothetical protein